MSNQVFSNRLGAGTRYLPRNEEIDILTLTKDSGSGPAIGSQTKAITTTGNGLFFSRLNGNDAVAVGGIMNYNNYQKAITKQYWQLYADSTVLGGATLLVSTADNVIAVQAVLPCRYGSGSGDLPLKLAIVVLDPANAVLETYSLANRDLTGGITTNDMNGFTLNAIVRVKAGQKIAVYGYSNATRNLTYEDDKNGTSSIIFEAKLSFTKL
jgi:hypothetical protein